MTINPFFEYTENENEQDFWNDQIIEAIQIFGRDVRYIPRHLVNFDKLLGADDSSRYDSSYVIEMLLENNYGYGGDKEFFSQFGHQVRDQVILTVSKDRFMSEVGLFEGTDMPNESDLIWHPMLKKLFVITYVDPREMFYQLGKIYTWQLTCEVFEYSGEEIETGDPDVDDLSEMSTNLVDWALTNENGLILTDEDGNVLHIGNYVIGEIVPTAENDYLPPELKTKTEFDISIQDPFGFLQGQ